MTLDAVSGERSAHKASRVPLSKTKFCEESSRPVMFKASIFSYLIPSIPLFCMCLMTLSSKSMLKRVSFSSLRPLNNFSERRELPQPTTKTFDVFSLIVYFIRYSISSYEAYHSKPCLACLS